jgi:hypothetical protein
MKKPRKKGQQARKRKKAGAKKKRLGPLRHPAFRPRARQNDPLASGGSKPRGARAGDINPMALHELIGQLPPELASMLASMSGNRGLTIGDPGLADLARELEGCDAELTIAAIAGLLTVPDYQAETLRLEMLVHLAVLHCAGERRPTSADITRWLHHNLVDHPVRSMEDPIEDVFVSNVVAPGGNYRVLEGIWETADHYVQDVMDCLALTSWGANHRPVLRRATALLRLSDLAIERASVARWAVSDQTYPKNEFLASDLDLQALGARVTVRQVDLEQLGVSLVDLAPFFMTRDERVRLRDESIGHTALERYPLIRFDDRVILACPTAVGAAIRRYVLETMAVAGETEELARMLQRKQSSTVYQSGLGQIDAPAAYATGLPKERPPAPKVPLRWNEVHCAIDTDKAAQVIFLPDMLEDATETGLTSPTSLPGELAEDLAAHVEATVTHLGKHARGGLAVIVYGGIGRGIALQLPLLPAHWHPVVMSVANFATFAWSPEASLLRLWKLNEQIERFAANGVQIVETNGSLNTYAYWRGRNFDLAPHDIPFPSEVEGMLQIGTDFILGLRVEERRLHDVHAVAVDVAGSAARVRRLARTAFFPAMEARPLYVSEDLAHTGELAGVFEHPELTVWAWATRPEDAPEASEFVYHLWEGLLSWLDRLVPELARELSAGGAPPVHLRIELEDHARWRGIYNPGEPQAERPTASLDGATQTAALNIPFGFLSLLRRPANDGERALLEVAAEAVLTLLSHSGHVARATTRVDSALRDAAVAHTAHAMRGPDTRFIHLFEATSPTDHLTALTPGRAVRPRFVPPEDMAAWQLGLAWTVLDRENLALRAGLGAKRMPGRAQDGAEPKTVDDAALSAAPGAAFTPDVRNEQTREVNGHETCMQALNALVGVVWERLRDDLREIDGPSLVRLALENQEAIFRDREQWRRTARAVMALYGEADDVERIAAERESQRANANTASRVLIEMAVCTSPRSGRVASLADLEHLTAGISTLIALASDSDAIRSGFAPARMAVSPNGAVTCDRTFAASVTNPFALESHASVFRVAAAAYADLYRRRATGAMGTGAATQATEVGTAAAPRFDEAFSRAFAAEYGLTPDRLLDALGELVDIGIEGGTLFVSTTREALASRLAAARGYSEQEREAFFRMLALEPRPAWDVAPRGFKKRDWYPWRFRRRLSLVARPLVTFGDDAEAPLFYGMYQLGASLSYLFENIQSAWLPEEFFRTTEMKQYRGAVANAEGAAFTQEVAAALRAEGCETRTEVLMSTIGAPPELGDLDVVAWRAKDERLLLIECKRLQPARTIGEIGELLKNFRGEAGDRLGKHLARCAWVAENPDLIGRALGVLPSACVVDPYLVTNRDVPMRYLAELVLAPDRIVPLDALAARLGFVR